jgi:glycosyltransferase involved in cell wall biosynthesis
VTPYVSVVVPTYRRRELLQCCLESLARQTLPANDYEVLVADDAGEAETQSLVETFARTAVCSVRYFSVEPAHGPAAARNCGWRAALGSVIAFTDDDCRPHPDWLRSGIDALGNAAAAAGRVVVPLRPQPTDYERDCAGLARGEFVTANCFCRRSALAAIGGFDERFTAAWREDSDLQFTLLENGFSIANAPEAVVEHPVRPARWGVSVSQQRKAQFNALLRRKHPELFRQRIDSIPRSYFLAGGSLLTATAAAAIQAWPIAIAAAGAWGLLTGRFCAARLRGTSRSPSHIAEMAITSALIPPLSLFWNFRGAWRFHSAAVHSDESNSRSMPHSLPT